MARITGHDGIVVNEIEQAAGVAGENGLLLCTLDHGREVDIKGFLEFLAGLRVEIMSK